MLEKMFQMTIQMLNKKFKQIKRREQCKKRCRKVTKRKKNNKKNLPISNLNQLNNQVMGKNLKCSSEEFLLMQMKMISEIISCSGVKSRVLIY